MINDPLISAGIDLGSNTFRLLVALCSKGHLEPIEKKMVTVRLGHGFTRGNYLREESLVKAFETLASFRKLLDQHTVRNLRICGTEALRSARNSNIFLEDAQSIMAHPVEIITGKEEAELTLNGVLAALTTARPDTMLLVDVGGGSTELILSEASCASKIRSLPIGAVGLTEQFFHAPMIKKDAVNDIQNSLIRLIKPALDELQLHDIKEKIMVFGCGGTATSMAALDMNLPQYDADLVQGHILKPGSIGTLWDKLSMLSKSERNRIPGLENGRGDILPAGIMIYRILLDLLGLNHMSVSDAGLLEGITASCVS